MEDRWSVSDRQVYGAEDDAEMDAIMQAIDEAQAKETQQAQSSTSSRSQKNSR